MFQLVKSRNCAAHNVYRYVVTNVPKAIRFRNFEMIQIGKLTLAATLIYKVHLSFEGKTPPFGTPTGKLRSPFLGVAAKKDSSLRVYPQALRVAPRAAILGRKSLGRLARPDMHLFACPAQRQVFGGTECAELQETY